MVRIIYGGQLANLCLLSRDHFELRTLLKEMLATSLQMTLIGAILAPDMYDTKLLKHMANITSHS